MSTVNCTIERELPLFPAPSGSWSLLYCNAETGTADSCVIESSAAG